MGIEHLLQRKLRELPPALQLQVLEFLENLRSASRPIASSGPPRRSLKGLWADCGVEITDEDIAESRREMWGDFPRGDV